MGKESSHASCYVCLALSNLLFIILPDRFSFKWLMSGWFGAVYIEPLDRHYQLIVGFPFLLVSASLFQNTAFQKACIYHCKVLGIFVCLFLHRKIHHCFGGCCLFLRLKKSITVTFWQSETVLSCVLHSLGNFVWTQHFVQYFTISGWTSGRP